MKWIHLYALVILISSCGGGDSGSKGTTTESTPTEESRRDPLESVELITPDGETINASVAETPKEQTQGLQYVRENEFGDNDGKLFFYLKDSTRTFWMPNTYFDLDLFYLDENLRIIDVVRDMPHYTGNVNAEIPRAPAIRSRHVLEMKASSPVADRLDVGDVLQWKSPVSLNGTENLVRQNQKKQAFNPREHFPDSMSFWRT